LDSIQPERGISQENGRAYRLAIIADVDGQRSGGGRHVNQVVIAGGNSRGDRRHYASREAAVGGVGDGDDVADRAGGVTEADGQGAQVALAVVDRRRGQPGETTLAENYAGVQHGVGGIVHGQGG